MEDNSIQAFGSVFTTVKARDREVIVDENGYINYTRLMESITGNRDSFRGICRMNKSLYAHVLHHDRAKLEAWAENELAKSEETSKMKNSSSRIFIRDAQIDEFLSSIKTIEVDALENANILIVRRGGSISNAILRGTYGPRYLLDFLLFNVDVSYYDSIHETIEALDAYAQTTNKSLAQELEELKKLYEFKAKEYEAESKAHEETKAKYDVYKAEAEARHQELLAKLEESAQREEELIAKNDKLLASNKEQKKLLKKSHQDIDTLQNMLFGMDAKVSDVQRTLHYRDDAFERLSKAAGFVVHEMKKQTIARSVTEASHDITVLYRTAMKPVNDDVRTQATETQIWLGSYNGDKSNYIPSKLPEDYDEIYYIESNRLNSFKYLLTHEEVSPFIVRSYQRSILIEEDDLDDFIDAVDRALNENREFKSVISLKNTKAFIESRKKEVAERNKERNLKSKILKDTETPHIVRNGFKRLVYCKPVTDEGKEVLTPLAVVDREFAIKAKWFYRYGAGGKYLSELTFSSIEAARFSKHGDTRIHS